MGQVISLQPKQAEKQMQDLDLKKRHIERCLEEHDARARNNEIGDDFYYTGGGRARDQQERRNLEKLLEETNKEIEECSRLRRTGQWL